MQTFMIIFVKEQLKEKILSDEVLKFNCFNKSLTFFRLRIFTTIDFDLSISEFRVEKCVSLKPHPGRKERLASSPRKKSINYFSSLFLVLDSGM